MNVRIVSFLKRWLLHSAVLLVIINLTDSITYLYYLTFTGNLIPNYTLWNRFVNHNIHQAMLLQILIMLLLAEINKLLFYKKKMFVFVVSSLTTGLAGASVLWISTSIRQGLSPTSFANSFWLIAGYAFVYPLVFEFIEKRVFKAEQLYQKSQAELIALKKQIQPHFLFNTLNSIYGTALNENAHATASSIEKLANLMRYVLDESSADYVPVLQEIGFLEEYINLQKIRLPDHISRQVVTRISYDEPSCVIAPLLLLPFIENAFKYGLSINHECFIDLQLSVSKCQLAMNIRNSIVNNSKGSGTGINNAKKRLQLLYPGKHTIDISHHQQYYNVQLGLQLS